MRINARLLPIGVVVLLASTCCCRKNPDRQITQERLHAKLRASPTLKIVAFDREQKVSCIVTDSAKIRELVTKLQVLSEPVAKVPSAAQCLRVEFHNETDGFVITDDVLVYGGYSVKVPIDVFGYLLQVLQENLEEFLDRGLQDMKIGRETIEQTRMDEIGTGLKKIEGQVLAINFSS